jgi:virginiamycin B lyase
MLLRALAAFGLVSVVAMALPGCGPLAGSSTHTLNVTKYKVPTAASKPDGITAGPDGNLWFTEFDANQVATVTPQGVFTEYPIPSTDSEPGFIAVGPDRNL